MNLLSFLQTFRKTSADSALIQYLNEHWDIRPKDLSCYKQALRHKSMVGSGKYCHGECNERLELLGDAVLDSVITEHLFKQYPQATEGELTKMRSRVVNRATLSLVGQRSGLEKFIETRINHVDSSESIVGNAVEALLGALLLDRGFDAVKACVLNVVAKRYMQFDDVVNNSNDFKSLLIEWAQQGRRSLQFSTRGDDTDKTLFVCEINLDGEALAQSKERSKKRAEQLAARQLCERLGLTTL